jgi:hypothetical protein
MLATKTEMSKRGNDTATIMIPRASSHILVKYALASGVSLTLSVSRPCEGLLLLLLRALAHLRASIAHQRARFTTDASSTREDRTKTFQLERR